MTEKTKTTQDIVDDFRRAGYIVNLSMSVPSFTKQDKMVRDQLAAEKNASPAVVNVSKKLLGTDRTYAALRSKASELRSYFRKNTLETNERGNRFLAVQFHAEFAAKMDVLINQCRALERELRANWDTTVQAAKAELGSMFEDPGECPTMKFEYSTEVINDGRDFLSMPSDIVPKETALALAKKAEERVVRSYKAAHEDLYLKLLEVAKRAKERLGEDGGRFTYTLVEQLAEVGKLGKTLNVFDDPELSEIASEMAKLGTSVTAEELRSDEKKREEVATSADQLVNKLANKSAMLFGKGGN